MTSSPRVAMPLWARMVGAFVAAAALATIAVLALVTLGVIEFELTQPAVVTPPVPVVPPPVAQPPVVAPIVPIAPLVPAIEPAPTQHEAPNGTADVCTRALACCYVFIDNIEGIDAPCEQLLGTSPADDERCRAQMDAWARVAIERGVELVECPASR